MEYALFRFTRSASGGNNSKKDIENNKNIKYFGKITKGWCGFSSEFKIKIPCFDKEVEIFLGWEWDDDGEEIETPPTEDELNEYENTLKKFLENIDVVTDSIKEKAFDYYNRIYAKYYEKEFVVESFFETDVERGKTHEPLNMDTKEKHFEYMKNINYIRILRDKKIIIPIFYKLDREHGLEIMLQENTVVNIDGIGENY
ncbi:MAG: hypothetical protein LBQ01_08775 [Prevotellaceae bacterium]|jgi:hypothetical protein|nr:hypothetical protein [Prevotellaceae bacterium]